MIKGLYAAASAMLVNLDRQQTLAHNIANIETIGFKQILTTLTDYEKTSVIFSPGNISHASKLYRIGEIGLGTDIGQETTDYTEGAIKATGNPLDLAINGAGFFRVRKDNEDYYTRDGRFIRDAENNLVTTDGYYVLDTAGNPIALPDENITIERDGTIRTTEQVVGQIALDAFANPNQDLTRVGGNLFKAAVEPSTEVEKGIIGQGYLEMSNINVSQIMTQMVMVSRSYETAQKMVVTQDTLLSETISRLGG